MTAGRSQLEAIKVRDGLHRLRPADPEDGAEGVLAEGTGVKVRGDVVVRTTPRGIVIASASGGLKYHVDGGTIVVEAPKRGGSSFFN